jgi:hypothetical protein
MAAASAAIDGKQLLKKTWQTGEPRCTESEPWTRHSLQGKTALKRGQLPASYFDRVPQHVWFAAKVARHGKQQNRVIEIAAAEQGHAQLLDLDCQMAAMNSKGAGERKRKKDRKGEGEGGEKKRRDRQTASLCSWNCETKSVSGAVQSS